MQPLPPLYCAETQERIWPEYFGLRKAVWCNGKPYLVDVARRLRLMPDPVPPKGFEVLQFGKPLPGFPVQEPVKAPAAAGASSHRNLPPAAAFKPAEIMAAAKSGAPLPAQPAEGSPPVQLPPTVLTSMAGTTPVPPSILAANPKVEEGTVITPSPVAEPSPVRSAAKDTGHVPTMISRPADMGTQEFRMLEAAAHALEEAKRHKEQLKQSLQGPTPPPLQPVPAPVSPAAISTLRATIVPTRVSDEADPASHVAVVRDNSERRADTADSAVLTLGEHPIGPRSDTVTALRLKAVPAEGTPPQSPSETPTPAVPAPSSTPVPQGEKAPEPQSKASESSDSLQGQEGVTRILLLKNLKEQQKSEGAKAPGLPPE